MAPMALLAMFYRKMTHSSGLFVEEIPNADLLGTIYVPVKVETLKDCAEHLLKK